MSSTPRKPPKTETWFALVVAGLALSFFAVICSPIVPYAKVHDFLSFYSGAWIVASGQGSEIYQVDLQERVQQTLSNGQAPVLAPYIRPPHYAWLLQPLAWLPLDHAFVVWLVVQIGLAFAIWFWAWKRFGADAIVYCSFFIPIGYGVLNGQDCVPLACLVLGAWLAAEKGRDGLAGVLLGATLFKFHMLTLLPLAMLLRRRWRMLGGWAVAGTLQVILSLWVVGPGGVNSYVALLTNQKIAALEPSVEMMINVSALLLNLGTAWLPLKALLSLAVAAAVCLVDRDAPLDRWFWAAVAGSLLIAPHTYEYDAASLLIPALLLLASGDPLQRGIGALVVMPVPFLMTVLGKPWSMAPSLVVVLLFLALAHPRLLAGWHAFLARQFEPVAGSQFAKK